jgi:hypothetical protein
MKRIISQVKRVMPRSKAISSGAPARRTVAVTEIIALSRAAAVSALAS